MAEFYPLWTLLSLHPSLRKKNPLPLWTLDPSLFVRLVYKLISKIVALFLKPYLDKFISPQQFGFLKNRLIAEPIAITQEVLHSVKTKNKCALILKLDLSKAFDKVNWSYLRLILLQIGVPLMGVNWIMGCLTSTNFTLLVNGTPPVSSRPLGESDRVSHCLPYCLYLS